MPILKVLIDEQDEVIGTAQADAGASGPGAPAGVSLIARPGQRVIEVTVDEAVARLDPERLHARIKADHLG
jgi:hypothetical protein